VTLAELNSLERAEFVARLEFLFEDSPWVAERAWARRPFDSWEALHRAMADEVARAGVAEQLALLRAHPDLGARAKMSQASIGEQAGAGLDRLEPEERDLLERRNTAYREKFGFPFLYAVKGSTRHAILEALAQRLEAAPEDEFQEALRQVYRIAWFRIESRMERLAAEGD
jgi:2-oxo-4-hydroxy-4-carboxy-5-ureidoimidazoline decarboxylase